MTEYWVSQGNKWCDYCKIFISNNPASIRNHELGERHKDSVAKRLNTMREDKAKKEKELKQSARLLEQIEAKASHSYQKDLASFQKARDSNEQTLDDSIMPGDWEYDSASGYYYNKDTGFYYDSNSGFYYTDALGKWVTREEALAAARVPSTSKPSQGKPPPTSDNSVATKTKSASTSESGPPPGRVVTTPVNPKRAIKGATSSVAVKRKKPDEKPKVVSKEEAAALKAREAARRRMEEREKPLLGLYKH